MHLLSHQTTCRAPEHRLAGLILPLQNHPAFEYSIFTQLSEIETGCFFPTRSLNRPHGPHVEKAVSGLVPLKSNGRSNTRIRDAERIDQGLGGGPYLVADVVDRPTNRLRLG